MTLCTLTLTLTSCRHGLWHASEVFDLICRVRVATSEMDSSRRSDSPTDMGWSMWSTPTTCAHRSCRNAAGTDAIASRIVSSSHRSASSLSHVAILAPIAESSPGVNGAQASSSSGPDARSNEKSAFDACNLVVSTIVVLLDTIGIATLCILTTGVAGSIPFGDQFNISDCIL